MHTCPECYTACTCRGDLDDIMFDTLPRGGCDCDCWREDEYCYEDADEPDGEECDYCGKYLSWGGNRVPSGAIACDSCEVEMWGTEGGHSADKRCTDCERETAHVDADGRCVECGLEAALTRRRTHEPARGGEG